MVEKQASSEIAQSRERFEKWWAESRELNPDCGCEKRGTRWFKCSYHEGADDAWEQAERDTRERIAQLVKLEDLNWDYRDIDAGEAVSIFADNVIERIRGKE